MALPRVWILCGGLEALTEIFSFVILADCKGHSDFMNLSIGKVILCLESGTKVLSRAYVDLCRIMIAPAHEMFLDHTKLQLLLLFTNLELPSSSKFSGGAVSC